MWLLVLIIDDYTAGHAKRRPQEDKLSEAKTMCTIVVKAFKDIPAISVENSSRICNENGIGTKSIIGIITFALCT